MTARDIEKLEQRGAALLGVRQTSVGKTQARQEFLRLVDELSRTSSAVTITDHEKPVALLLSYNHWLALISKLTLLSKQDSSNGPINLLGSIEIVGDLEAGSKRAAEAFTQSIRDSATKL